MAVGTLYIREENISKFDDIESQLATSSYRNVR
jgi:hypothetical protein